MDFSEALSRLSNMWDLALQRTLSKSESKKHLRKAVSRLHTMLQVEKGDINLCLDRGDFERYILALPEGNHNSIPPESYPCIAYSIPVGDVWLHRFLPLST